MIFSIVSLLILYVLHGLNVPKPRLLSALILTHPNDSISQPLHYQGPIL